MRAMIIDDEDHNISNLRTMLKKYCTGVEVVATATSGSMGRDILMGLTIDVLFLDIELSDGTGFDMLKSLEKHDFQIIFVTGYDRYAIEAIRISALDYILKPIGIDELKSAVEKASRMMLEKESDLRLEGLLKRLGERDKNSDRLALPMMKETRYIKFNRIISMQALSNYTRFNIQDLQPLTITSPMAAYEEKARPYGFFRPHNKWVVNRAYVEKMHNTGNASYLELTDGSSIPVARNRKEFVKDYLNGHI